jgi:hypothetical protein
MGFDDTSIFPVPGATEGREQADKMIYEDVGATSRI